MQYSSLQHWTLLSPLDTPTPECCFCFGPATSFFPDLFVIALHFSPVKYWTPSSLEGSSSGIKSFCLFILFMGFLWPKYWGGLPFPSSVDHILSELLTITHPSWVALHSMAHSFIELCKTLCHDKAMIHERIHILILNFFIF